MIKKLIINFALLLKRIIRIIIGLIYIILLPIFVLVVVAVSLEYLIPKYILNKDVEWCLISDIKKESKKYYTSIIDLLTKI